MNDRVTEDELRAQIVEVTKILAEEGLIRSSDGNISVRMGDRLLITPSGVYKRALAPEQMVVVDLTGEVLDAPEGLGPTSELLMHLEVYRQRGDVGAVLHAHPPYATALTVSEAPFPIDVIPEVLLTLGDVPTAPYATPGTQDLADSIRDSIGEYDAVLLSHHGSLTVGETLEEALIALERVEHVAQTFILARGLGGAERLPAEEVARLRAMGKRVG